MSATMGHSKNEEQKCHDVKSNGTSSDTKKFNTSSSNGTTSPKLVRKDSGTPATTPQWVFMAIVLVVVISYVTFPVPFQPVGEPTIQHVFYYGWLTAVSTGFGVLPLAFAPDLAKFWIGISNAVAAGMMIAASYSLFVEGCTFHEPRDTWEVSNELRTGLGALAGLAFLIATKQILDQYEDLQVAGLAGGADARRALLILFVMTLHSFSEGVGIGVSFGGTHGSELGVFISASLAVHNVPEGLAMGVVLLPQKTAILTAAVWAIISSIPQPIMAVPAYWFVHAFIPILPIGLGFAGGAMAWVAVMELMVEAVEDAGLLTTATTSTCSLLGMLALQHVIDGGARS